MPQATDSQDEPALTATMRPGLMPAVLLVLALWAAAAATPSFGPGLVAVVPLWVACGLAFGALMVLGTGARLAVIVGLGLGAAWVAPSAAGAVGQWLAALCGVSLCHLMIQRMRVQPRTPGPRDALACLAAAAFAAAGLSVVQTLAGLALGWPQLLAHGARMTAGSGTGPVMALQAWAISLAGFWVWGVAALLALDWRQAQGSLRWQAAVGVALASLLGQCVLGLAQHELRLTPWVLLPAFVPFLLLPWLAWRGQASVAAVAAAVAGTAALWAASRWWSLHMAGGAWVALGAWAYMVTLMGGVWACMALSHGARALDTRAQLMLQAANLGVADWQLDRGQGSCNGPWHHIVGQHCATPVAWLELVHNDDRSSIEHALHELRLGRTPRVSQELRLQAGEGWRWVEARMVAAEHDLRGHARRVIATVEEISARREAQERERLSSSLFQHSHEGLLVTDAQMRVLDANPAYTQILGVPRHEVLGTVPQLLRADSPDPLARQQRANMWAGLNESGNWRGEFVESRRNGEPCTLQVTISTVKGPNDTVRYHVLVISDITDSRIQRDRLERQAHFDELTRLPNRARIQDMLASAMRAVEQDGNLLAVCYLDLDHFKPVNDKYGHAAGDMVLAQLADRLRSTLRSNEMWADAAGRIGGDEFVLLLRAATMEEARLAVERVLRVISQPYALDFAERPVALSASLGATVYPLDRSDADTLMRHADHAMYGAKQAGRNGYQFFDPEHRRRTEERILAISRVQEAFERQEFALYYQPKVDMRSNTVVGVEALLRWKHPQHGMISPQQFVPLIEHTGLSARIGDWVISQALQHLAGWHREGLRLSVSVNVSARHLQEPDFGQRLAELLGEHPEPLARHLELEVLETAAQADVEATSELISRCKRLGVRFALDDFGTGYSTLNYLKRLPVDVLKIDRAFVAQMLENGQDRAIVANIIDLARTFNCVVVAEGVQTPAQARTLLEMGCHIGQGLGISAPLPAQALAPWVRGYTGIFTPSLLNRA